MHMLKVNSYPVFTEAILYHSFTYSANVCCHLLRSPGFNVDKASGTPVLRELRFRNGKTMSCLYFPKENKLLKRK